MDFLKFLQSDGFKKALWIIGGTALALLIFNAGVAVGFRKASFSSGAGDNYYRAFGTHSGRTMAQGFSFDNLGSGSGAAGEIVKVSLPDLVIADQDGTEKTVVIDPQTIIRKSRVTIASGDIREDDYAVVLGTPDAKGKISARFIRILPPPPSEVREASSTNAANQ